MTAVNNRESVHSYYKTKNWLTHQDQRFRGRTSLFRDQISRGNASLQLTEVEVRDEGRYRCYASTRTGYNESFINLRVDAPVHEVNFQKVENRIICSSDGIYPEPELTWSINPPSSLTLQSTTKVQRTEQQLYNISSSLMLSDNVTDLDYICTINTHTNSRRASLIRQSHQSMEMKEYRWNCSIYKKTLVTRCCSEVRL
ncbi:programmed cell death 1 ligand 1-like [Scomber japonicus]|uniref:programmed cell death 1 ligand 1-like n=1 Tax=Scomber japonicus TaxID=13676 RepID=UPI002306D398|nr:programmed cell death 1 ligand 1-like [Scomber japonicus]